MKFGLRLPSFALGPKTASLHEMGAYLRRAEDLGFDCAVSIDTCCSRRRRTPARGSSPWRCWRRSPA